MKTFRYSLVTWGGGAWGEVGGVRGGGGAMMGGGGGVAPHPFKDYLTF